MKNIIIASASVKNIINEKEKSIATMEKWIEKSKKQNAELILFPELNVSGYITKEISKDIAETIPGPSTDKIINLARKHKIIICFGLIEKANNNNYCTHVLVDENGLIGKQRKIHVPFQEQKYWRFGDEIVVFDIKKAKIGITVCRDSFFEEMTRTLYFKGAEILLMPFSYPHTAHRKDYIHTSIHGWSIVKASWTNGFYNVYCNSAETIEPNDYITESIKYPGWAGIISPWGQVIDNIDTDGNNEAMVVQELDPSILIDRRKHPNFLAEELRNDLYRLQH